jgi:PAS domain S-box-containing protein
MTAQREVEEQQEIAIGEGRRAFDAVTDAVMLLDANAVVVRANAAATRLTGRGIDEIVGSLCCAAVHGLAVPHPDCARRRALQSGNVETSIIRQDGAWLRMTFHPIRGPGGRVHGGVHVICDVTSEEQVRRDLQDSDTRRQAISEGLFAVLAATSEAGESCSPGHQRRVSERAATIAQTMGVSADRVEGIRLAALVHDVGNHSVPPEVLAKPGPLTAAEFELVKRHAQASHDILAPIDLPWPIADVALQHHERLDGSGYPAGSSGEAIALEARIVAVADVMEAMTADRPHRPAPGVDAALEEIAAGAGTRYDPHVCAACLRAVREQGSTPGQ